MSIVGLIANNNYIVVNKRLATIFGIEAALVLGELASEFEYWQKNEGLKDGYFFSTIENVKENTTLSDKRQRAALAKLQAVGIVEVKLMGLPAKRYIRIDEKQLLPYLLNSEGQNGETSCAETAKLEMAERQVNNNNSNNNNSNNIKKESKRSFDALVSGYANGDQEITDLLGEWLKVRKAKRAAMTDKAIELNLAKLDKCARDSRMSVAEYLREVICRGWQAFYVINNYGSGNGQGKQKQQGSGNIFKDIWEEEHGGVGHDERGFY